MTADPLDPMASYEDLYCTPSNPCGACDQCVDEVAPPVRLVPNEPDEQPTGKRPTGIKLVPASSVPIDRPYWAWDKRIPVGGTTLMPGREGLGKTALVCWLMARLTRGQLPGQWWRRPAEVVYIGVEDDRSSVLVPRLVAAGADLSKVQFIEMPDGMSFSVGVDCSALADALKGRDVALVVVDPLDGHLVGLDTHRKSEVQQAVAKLAGFAQDVRCGALGLAHLNKGDTRELLGRVVGSVGFTTSVRSVLGVGEHPDNPDERVCVVGKANMTDKGAIPAVRFKVEKAHVDHPDGGEPIDTGKVVVLGEEDGIDPNVVIDSGSMAERTVVEAAEEWLNAVLSEGPQASVDVKKWAKAADFSERTLQRARAKVGVKVTRNDSEQGRPSVWELASSGAKPFVPGVSRQTPLADNRHVPDQGKRVESGGFVPGSGIWHETPSEAPNSPPCTDCGGALVHPKAIQEGRCEKCRLSITTRWERP